MKKFLLLFILTFPSIITICQACDKFVEWDLDDNSIKKELPYNQTICFRLKSKTISFDKVIDVFILEHKGTKNMNFSLEYYKNKSSKNKNDSDLLGRKFHSLKIKKYDKENKTLDVELIDDSSPDDLPNTQHDYVLQPSKQYSIILFTSEPSKRILRLLDSVKLLLDLQKSEQTQRLVKVDSNIKKQYDIIAKHYIFRSEYFAEDSASQLIEGYRQKVYPEDSKISHLDSVLSALESAFKRTVTFKCKFTDSISFFIERQLSMIVSKDTCTSQFPCEINKCSLYKYLLSLSKNKDTAMYDNLLMGKAALSDFTNPIFKKGDREIEDRINNIDSTIVQLSNLNLYLQNLFINDCKKYNCCDSFLKKYDLEKINNGITSYISCLDILIDSLKSSKQLYISLKEAMFKRSAAIINLRLIYDVIQIQSGNTLTYGLEPRNKLIITPVFGYAYYGFQKGFNSFTPCTGISISFAPLNDTVDYKFLKQKTLAQKLNFFTGITLSSLKEDNKRDNLFSNGSNLMAGLGYKINHVITFNLGTIIFKKEDPDIFTSNKKVSVTPYTSIGINLKLRSLFEGLYGLLPGK